MELRFVLECRNFGKWHDCQLFLHIWQELLCQYFNHVIGFAQLNVIQRINFFQSARPIVIWTKSFVDVGGGIDKLDSNIGIVNLIFQESLDRESLSFMKISGEANVIIFRVD